MGPPLGGVSGGRLSLQMPKSCMGGACCLGTGPAADRQDSTAKSKQSIVCRFGDYLSTLAETNLSCGENNTVALISQDGRITRGLFGGGAQSCWIRRSRVTDSGSVGTWA